MSLVARRTPARSRYDAPGSPRRQGRGSHQRREVLQEVLHRYQAIKRFDAIQPGFDVLLDLVDEALPIELVHVERAKQVAMGAGRLSARDALHVAVMESVGVSRILSYDGGFDAVPGLERLT